MKGATTGKTSKRKSGADFAALRRRSDVEIRVGIEADPDARLTDEAFWKEAKVVWPQPKQVVTMRLDADLLAWFRKQSGYQTRINAILRSYMQAHQGGTDTATYRHTNKNVDM